MVRQLNISVIGAGLMGHGIAVSFAREGHRVAVFDTFTESLKTLHTRSRDSLQQLGHDEQETETALSLIEAKDDLEAGVAGAQLVVEAAPEDLDIKRQIFADVEAAVQESCILASNTSVIPISSIMEKLKAPGRALGTHWWNPPFMIPLVEVIRTEQTSEHTITWVMDVLQSVGKTPVRVEKDVPGFIGNRLQHALWREAISLVENGICDAEAVDTVIKSSFGRRLSVLGPLENADLVGTDLTLAIHNNVLSDLESSGEPSPYLKNLVAEGRLGMKAGEGFLKWTPDRAAALRARVADHLRKLQTILE